MDRKDFIQKLKPFFTAAQILSLESYGINWIIADCEPGTDPRKIAADGRATACRLLAEELTAEDLERITGAPIPEETAGRLAEEIKNNW